MDNETFSHRLDEHWRRDMDELTREMSREPAGFCDCLVGVGMLGLYLIFLPIMNSSHGIRDIGVTGVQ